VAPRVAKYRKHMHFNPTTVMKTYSKRRGFRAYMHLAKKAEERERVLLIGQMRSRLSNGRKVIAELEEWAKQVRIETLREYVRTL